MEKLDVFYQAKLIPFPEVQASFNGEEPRRGKILCPFHPESTASFQIYHDGYKCFGCQAAGDNIDFVARLAGVKPYRAANMIAERFGLSTNKPLSKKKLQQINKAKQKRTISQQYHKLEHRAFLNLIEFRDTIDYIVQLIGLDDLPDTVIDNVHELPQVEEYLRVLSIGSTEERLRLLRTGVIRKWARI